MESNTDPDEDETLKGLISQLPVTIQQQKRHVGTAVMPDLLREETYSSIVKQEFNSLCVEHHLKWEPLLASKAARTGESVYDFTDADFIVDWALANGMEVKGHTLVWHVTSPKFLEEKTSAELREAVRRHIHTTCGHFYSRVHSWDVVNEALAPDGSFAETMFTRKLNAMDFIEECFRWARNADPKPRLFYNDNKVEAVSAIKSKEMVDMLQVLISRKTPLEGAGLQTHFDAAGTGAKRPAAPRSIYLQIERLGALGLGVNISEMDVRIAKLSHLPEAVKIQAQCDIYEKTLTSCLRSPHFDGVTFWGFTDKHTWCNSFYWPDTPLLFDSNYKKKPAYYSVCKAIKNVLREMEWEGEWVPSSPKKEAISVPNPTLSSGTDQPDWILETT